MRHRAAAGVSLESGRSRSTAGGGRRRRGGPKIPGSYKHYPTPSNGKVKIAADVQEYAKSAASAQAAEGFQFNRIVMAPEPAPMPQTPRCAQDGSHRREMAGSKVHRVGPSKEEEEEEEGDEEEQGYSRGLASFRTALASDTGGVGAVAGSPERSRYRAPATPSTRAPPPTMGGDGALTTSSFLSAARGGKALAVSSSLSLAATVSLPKVGARVGPAGTTVSLAAGRE